MIGGTPSPMIGKQICHPPEELTDPDPELPNLSHRETLLGHQEGHRVHLHLPEDLQTRDQDLSQLDVADQLSQNAPGVTVAPEMIVEAEMAVQIVPTAAKAMSTLTVRHLR